MTGPLSAVGLIRRPALAPTPETPEGPAWREGSPHRDDLVPAGAKGTPLLLEGRVLWTDGRPVEGAVLDLWQASPRGWYDMLSPRMRFRGRVRAGAGGAWRVRTLVPGPYLWRPPHVHVKVFVDGSERLTTQLYLPGSARLRIDPWVIEALVLELHETGEGGRRAGYDLVLRP